MRGHRPRSAFMQLLGFLSLAARYAAIPANFRKTYIYIYLFIYIREFHRVLGCDNMGAEWDIDIE